MSACKANLAIGVDQHQRLTPASTPARPAEDWWDGCLWRDRERERHQQHDRLQPGEDPALQPGRTGPTAAQAASSASTAAPPYNAAGGWVIPTQLTFFQNNIWSDNAYNGPSTFYAWNQGNGDNPVSWAAWTGSLTGGDKCSSAGERQSGYCTGPFGQDAGSTYNAAPKGG